MHIGIKRMDRILDILAGIRRRWDGFLWELEFLRQVTANRKGLILGYQVYVRQASGEVRRQRYLWVGRRSETEIRHPNGDLARFSGRVGRLYRPAPWGDEVA